MLAHSTLFPDVNADTLIISIGAQTTSREMSKGWASFASRTEVMQPAGLLEHHICVAYGKFDRIQAIYAQKTPEAFNVFVFVNSESYDDALMDRLLDKEIELLKAYPDILFDFKYPPVAYVQPADYVPSDATLIFHR
jgi:hypothetical protein